jgi:predicted nucleic acid-binding protein
MNVVDSSGWLEYVSNGTNASFFAPVITDSANLIVPSISIYAVFKRMLQQRGEAVALQVVHLMSQGRVVDLDQALAIGAAKTSAALKIPIADSIILATARAHGATLWTQDVDLAGQPDVQYVSKNP